ncbi:MAG: hypothetical protein LC624_04415, partial [Halobacteriales archaeon]|nr:hypothetical protein [Halobacteriales archaeon]
VVGLSVGDGNVSGSFVLLGSGNVTILNRSSGNNVFYARGNAFAGEANVLVQAGVLEVRTMDDVSFNEHSIGRLFGEFIGGSNTGDLSMRILTPSGSSTGRTDYHVANGESGDYQFIVDHDVDVSTACNLDDLLICPPPEILAFGADVSSE